MPTKPSKGKEFKFTFENAAKVKIGNIDGNDKIIFCNTSFWIVPKDKEADYHNDMYKLKSFFIRKVNETVIGKLGLFSKKYISHFDNKTNYMVYNKRSFVMIELLTRQNGEEKITSIRERYEEVYREVLGELFQKIRDMDYEICPIGNKKHFKKEPKSK